jgi:hypothetical protein
MRRAPPPPPQPPRQPAGEQPPDASGAELPLPHERDESPHASAPQPDPAIRQAGKDLAAGQVDTDMRATPGLDAQRRERLVPGTAGRVRRRR